MQEFTVQSSRMWNNRIVGFDMVDPRRLTAHPLNFREHPGFQGEALRGSLTVLGWVKGVVVNRRTGRVIDGHLRVEDAIAAGESVVPVCYVDLDEGEEPTALAYLDPVAALAVYNAERSSALLRSLGSINDERLARHLENVRNRSGATDLENEVAKEEDAKAKEIVFRIQVPPSTFELWNTTIAGFEGNVSVWVRDAAGRLLDV
jgi:hypothetical protein